MMCMEAWKSAQAECMKDSHTGLVKVFWVNFFHGPDWTLSGAECGPWLAY